MPDLVNAVEGRAEPDAKGQARVHVKREQPLGDGSLELGWLDHASIRLIDSAFCLG